MAKHKKNKQDEFLNEPTPRLIYDGDTHPFTGQKVFRTDAVGLIAARREIARKFGDNHSGIEHINNDLAQLRENIVNENSLPN